MAGTTLHAYHLRIVAAAATRLRPFTISYNKIDSPNVGLIDFSVLESSIREDLNNAPAASARSSILPNPSSPTTPTDRRK